MMPAPSQDERHAGAPSFLPTMEPPAALVVTLPTKGFNLDRHLERVRADFIAQALARTRGHQARAAALLGLSPRVLNYILTTRSFLPIIDVAKAAEHDDDGLHEMRAYIGSRIGKDGWL